MRRSVGGTWGKESNDNVLRLCVHLECPCPHIIQAYTLAIGRPSPAPLLLIHKWGKQLLTAAVVMPLWRRTLDDTETQGQPGNEWPVFPRNLFEDRRISLVGNYRQRKRN